MAEAKPQCGDATYQRCPDCQAHRSEPHLAGCPEMAADCYWCGTWAEAPGHDLNAYMQAHTNGATP